mgnify:CR=1 FL=1
MRELLEYLGHRRRCGDNLASNLSYGQQKLLDFGMALDARARARPARRAPGRRESHHDQARWSTTSTALNAPGYTFVVIEHNMEVVMSLCRRIVVLSQGERIAEGTAGRGRRTIRSSLDAYFGR